MRIRHVLPQPAMGILPPDPANAAMTGVISAVWSLAVHQAAAGHEVEIVAPGESGRCYQRIDGIDVYWLSSWRRWRTARYDFSYLSPLYLFALRSRRVDITHVHSNPFHLLASARSNARVLHFHNSPVKCSPRYDQALARAHTVICCSHFIGRQLTDVVTYPASRIHVIHNGVDCEQFARVDRAAARAAYGIPDGQVVLLYAGRIGPEKGLLVLIESLEQMVAFGGEIPLLLVAGSGTLGYEAHQAAWNDLRSYEGEVRQRASRLPVRFLGNVPRRDLPRLYRAADVFVCPSIYDEPFGMVNVEAAAAGLPVIASAAGGIPEAVIHERTGLLVAPGDASALSDAIRRLVSDHLLRFRLADQARVWVSRFDWQLLTREVLGTYEMALRTAGVPPTRSIAIG